MRKEEKIEDEIILCGREIVSVFKDFLRGIWKGMGPEPTRRTTRTIKSPPEARPGTMTVSKQSIKNAVRKSPPKRRL